MKKLFLGIALCLVPLFAFAVTPDEVRSLVTNSGSVKQMAIDVEIQRLSVNQQWMDYLPDLQFQYKSAYSSIFTSGYDATHAIALTSGWDLFQSGDRYLEHSVERLQLEGLLIDYRVKVESGLTETLSLLLSALKARDTMAVAASNEVLLKIQFDRIAAKFAQGSVSEMDRLTAEADYQNALYEKKNTVMLADKALSDLTRHLSTNVIELDDWKTLFESPLNPIDIPMDTVRFPTVTKQSNLICVEEINRISALKARWLPSVSLSASIDWGQLNFVASRNSWSNQSMEPRVDLSVSFPIFEKGSSMAAIRKEEYLIEQKKIELNTLIADNTAEMVSWIKDHNDRLELLEVARKRAASALLTEKKALESYQLGAKSLLDWMLAEKSLREAELALLDNLYEIWNLRVKIGQAMGDSFLYISAAR